MPSDYGSGPSLTDRLDLELDATGDISLTSGTAELEKDLAFRLLNTFESQTFGIIDPATREDIRVNTRTAILADDRVDSIIDISVIDTETLDQVAIGVTVQADGEQVETVAEV